MKHILSIAIALTLFAGTAMAQGANPGASPQVFSGSGLSLSLTDPPQQVPSASVSRTGNPGNVTYYYWIVTQGTAGASSPAGPFVGMFSAAALSGSTFNQVSWTTVANGLTYDVLRTITPAAPTGACACAVATGVVGNTQSDQSNSLSAYTVTTLAPSTLGMTLTNESSAAGASELRLRVNGTKVAGFGSSGILNAILGLTINGTAPNGHCLVGNGTAYVDSSSCGGGGGFTDLSKTANYTLLSTDFNSPSAFVHFKPTTTGIVAKLPSTAPASGLTATIVNESIYPMTIDPQGNQLAGIAWVKALPCGSGVTVESDGTNYHIVGSFEGPAAQTCRRTYRGTPNDVAVTYTWDVMAGQTLICQGPTDAAHCEEVAGTATTPVAFILSTSASNNSIALTDVNQGDLSTGNSSKPTLLEWKQWIQLSSASPTNQRIWAGIVSCNGQNFATQLSSDLLARTADGCNPGGAAAFRLSTAFPDSTWICVNSSGAAQTETSTGLTLDTNFHLFEVRIDDVNSKTLFMVDGVVVCGAHSNTNFPSAGAQPYAGVGIITLTTAIKTLNISTAAVSVGH